MTVKDSVRRVLQKSSAAPAVAFRAYFFLTMEVPSMSTLSSNPGING
jgi:hypothetical protein